MLLMPNENWQWKYDSKRDALLVELGNDLEFITELKSKVLIPDALSTQNFIAKHAQYYCKTIESLKNKLKLSDPQIVQIALNATASKFMWQQQAPKSYLFEESFECVYSQEGKPFYLQTAEQKCLTLVIEASHVSSILLLLSDVKISVDDALKAFTTVKVLNSRLHPLVQQPKVVATPHKKLA